LRYTFAREGAILPSAAKLEDILRQLLSTGASAKLRVTFGDTEIRTFGGLLHLRETSVPPPVPIQRDVARRTVAIVVDDLGMSAESMTPVRRQVRKFIAEEVQPNDLVAIIRTGGQMGALQQFTNDKRVLNRAIERLRWQWVDFEIVK